MIKNQKKQELHDATHELLKVLNQYKMHQSTIRNQAIEEQEKYFLNQIQRSQLQKLDIELLKLYDYLEDNGLDNVKDVVDSLFGIVKENKSLQNKQKVYGLIQIEQNNKTRNGQYCQECGQVIEKSKIIKIKQTVGITYGETKNEQKIQLQKVEKISIKNQLDDDGFLEKFTLHIGNIDFHIQQLTKAMEREIISKAFAFLSKETDQVKSKEFNLEQERQIILKNEKQVLEIQDQKKKLTQSFMNKLRIPICNAILKVLQKVDEKKTNHIKQIQKQQACQTIFTKQNQIIRCLEQKISQLNKELIRTKAAKTETDKKILNFIQSEGKLKLENNRLLLQTQIYQQRIAKQKHNTNKIEAKYFQQLNCKAKQIERLSKLTNDLKSQMPTQKRNSIDRSKSSIGTIQKKISHRSILERESNPNLKQFPRPSVDLTLHEQELLDMVSISRFNQEKKAAIGQRRNTKFWRETKTILKSPEVNLPEESKKIETKNSQKQRLQKLQKLTIVSQLSVKIEAKKLTQNELQKIVEAKILENKNKKLKNVRIAKSHRENKSGFTASTILQENFVYQNQSSSEENQKPGRLRVEQKVRFRTEFSEFQNHHRRPIQKLKSGFVSGRNLKSRAKDVRQEQIQIILNSPQINSQSLVLFGGQSSAQDYEKNTGIWPHLNITDKLAVDFQNAGYCLNIQKHFKFLEQIHPQIYSEYVLFLNYPIQLIQQKRKNLPYTDISFPEGRTKIKDIFIKIMRYHRILHKTCNHVAEFLNSIGFTSQS